VVKIKGQTHHAITFKFEDEYKNIKDKNTKLVQQNMSK